MWFVAGLLIGAVAALVSQAWAIWRARRAVARAVARNGAYREAMWADYRSDPADPGYPD